MQSANLWALKAAILCEVAVDNDANLRLAHARANLMDGTNGRFHRVLVNEGEREHEKNVCRWHKQQRFVSAEQHHNRAHDNPKQDEASLEV